MAQVGNLICTGTSRFLNKIYGACTDGSVVSSQTQSTKFLRQDFAYVLIYSIHHLGGEGLTGKCLIGIYHHTLRLVVDNDIVLAAVKSREFELGPVRSVVLEVLRQGTRNSFVDTLCRQNRYSKKAKYYCPEVP